MRDVGNDELLLDHAWQLSPQGHLTFSCGMMEAAYSLSALPHSSLQAPGLLVVFFGHTWAGDLSLTESSITSPLPGCHSCAQRHKPMNIRLEHRALFPFPFLHFHFLFSQSLFTCFCLSVFLYFFLSLHLSSYLFFFSPFLFGDG